MDTAWHAERARGQDDAALPRDLTTTLTPSVPRSIPGAQAPDTRAALGSIRSIQSALIVFVALSVLLAWPVGLLYLDIQGFGHDVGEWSAVELAQLAMLTLIVTAFATLAARSRRDRRGAVLAGAFFACMGIRELDAVWDLILDGLWQWLVATTATSACLYALLDWRATLAGLGRLLASRRAVHLMTGLAVLLVYSRLLGMGALWEGLLDEQYLRVFKNAIEESAELLGYTLMAYACVGHVRARLRGAGRSGERLA